MDDLEWKQVDERAKIPNIKGVWYHVDITECVICGCTSIIRERQLPPKPENPYTYHQDACGDHFA
jgi:hypothetical protein